MRFNGADRNVTKGPFVETNELIAGYWIWNVQSMDEALEWVKKCPNPMEEGSDIEIRTFYEMDDFSEVDTSGKFSEREKDLRNTLAMQQATINSYLFFSGRCEEALNFYQQHLSAKVEMLMRFNESPDPVPDYMLQEGFDNKVMHAEFSVGPNRVLASDGCNDNTSMAGFSLALTVQEKAHARRIFEALAQGGTISMPLAETFWSPLFGSVTDQFGVSWMIMLPGEEPK